VAWVLSFRDAAAFIPLSVAVTAAGVIKIMSKEGRIVAIAAIRRDQNPIGAVIEGLPEIILQWPCLRHWISLGVPGS
jgi:hypothetical protein